MRWSETGQKAAVHPRGPSTRKESVVRRIVGLLVVLLIPAIGVPAAGSLAASGTAVLFTGTITVPPSAAMSSAAVPTATLLVVPESQFQAFTDSPPSCG